MPREHESSKSDPGPFKYAWILFAIVGYGAMGFSVYSLVSNTALWIRAESTEGTIQGWEYIEQVGRTPRRANVSRAKANVVSYETADGTEVVFVTEFGSASVIYDEGETVTVLYDPDDPEGAKILGFVSLYLGPLILLLFGAVFWGVSVLAKAFAS